MTKIILNWLRPLLIFSSIFILLTFSEAELMAQTDKEKKVSPRGAFLRSMAIPGWGHHYVDNTDWNRGKYHLAGEAVLVLSYLGLYTRANYLENDFRTYAQSHSGAQLSGKSRDYLIALGNYDTLSEYNQAQLRSRNWNALFPETQEYQWNWDDPAMRLQYQDTREKVDRTRNQLPTLVVLMVGNRFASAISAFLKARNRLENVPEARFTYLSENGYQGVAAQIRFEF